MEARPDQRFRVDYFNKVDQARTRIERYVAAPPLSIVLLENASAGVNSVLRSIVWTEGDVILYLSTAYNMVKFTAKWLHEVRDGCQKSTSQDPTLLKTAIQTTTHGYSSGQLVEVPHEINAISQECVYPDPDGR